MTTQEAAGTSVRSSVTVEASIERAFKVFTTGMATWWPPTHHILEGELAEMVFEARQGGHIYDRGTDGRECHWARVLAYEPPGRLVFSWDITPEWAIETDPSRASEVEVTFVAESPQRTRVELVHRHLDRHGDGWERERDSVGSSEGWDVGMGRFAAAAAVV